MSDTSAPAPFTMPPETAELLQRGRAIALGDDGRPDRARVGATRYRIYDTGPSEGAR